MATPCFSCPLCLKSNSIRIDLDKSVYYRCSTCDLIFLDPRFRLTPDEEEKRYRLHQNDMHDPAYREFLRPICDAIRENVKVGACGLDYGSGSQAMMAELLSEFEVTSFDPVFFPDGDSLQKSYDFIVCSEVMEHFFSPAQEFQRLQSLLKPGGVLACASLFHMPETDFATWYYRRDPTHVVFYSHKTLRWIAENFGFAGFRLHSERVALFWFDNTSSKR